MIAKSLLPGLMLQFKRWNDSYGSLVLVISVWHDLAAGDVVFEFLATVNGRATVDGMIFGMRDDVLEVFDLVLAQIPGVHSLYR
jgi:hypothetical protein